MAVATAHTLSRVHHVGVPAGSIAVALAAAMAICCHLLAGTMLALLRLGPAISFVASRLLLLILLLTLSLPLDFTTARSKKADYI